VIIIQRVVGRALSLSQVSSDVLRIGRGTNAELRSENPAVALEHAVIERDQDGYFTIADRGSITGTYVNARPVETARLNKGDLIEVGDLRVEVQNAEAGKPLFLRVVTKPRLVATAADFGEEDEVSPAIAAGGGGQVRARVVDFASAFALRRAWLTKGTLVALLLIVTLLVIGELAKPSNQEAFMPGGVSSAHARARDASGQSIAKNCAACHDPWRGVSDDSCGECHSKAPHSELQADTMACSSCHMEHRGSTKLAVIADARCVACHGNVKAHVKVEALSMVKTPDISAFDEKHPDFTWRKDENTMRFNHKLHLQTGGIFDAAGHREVLSCANCHKLVETKGKVDPAPIRFATACQRCHLLTFDRRFPDLQVPHGGDPGLLYGFVLATYAGNRDIAGKSPEDVRRILTSRPPTEVDQSAVINAEQVIKTKCTLCHDVGRAGGRLVAVAPVIPTQWLQHARFAHTQHRNLNCETCHEKARTSRATSDVLMPSRKDCTDCHGPRVVAANLGAAKTSSGCITCHEYHERSRNLMTKVSPAFTPKRSKATKPETDDNTGMLGIILLFAILLLMIAIVVPLGLTWYQRLRASDAEKAKPAAAAPKVRTPPPPMAPAAPKAAAAPAKADTAPKAAAPPADVKPAAPPVEAAAPPPADATQFVKAAAPDAPQATEMVMWNGMLLCSAGPLEGQRFIIEDEGFYIGRDASLSKVVIPDGRVSKRHVRIVPRDGKVWAIDQNSTNGTFLGKAGGQRITEVQLKRGDTLVLADGAATFVYQI
jgi:pSer/pThr/pTyr-binding forkhead associated (FHA) protein